MSKICFVGGGSFGTSLSLVLGDKGYDISIWARREEIVNEINDNRKNSKYLKDMILPENVTAYNDIEKALQGCDIVVLAVPSHAIREASRKISKYIDNNAVVVSIAKGIEESSQKRLSVVIEEEIPGHDVVVLSGPSHAEEIAMGMPTTLVASCKNMECAKKIQDVFMTPKLRIYTNDDIIGVEIGGAVKNIIAFAAGALDGIGYGDNAKAALMTRGMSEIIRIGVKLGGKQETFYGLTGMGDLIVTCTSMHSRNRRAGILIAEGYSVEEACNKIGMVVEGIKACRAFHDLKENLGVSMPITEALYDTLYRGLEPDDAVHRLMTRDKKSE